jgi:GTP cyclohydrolase I
MKHDSTTRLVRDFPDRIPVPLPPTDHEMNQERVTALVRELLVELGEDPDREGLLKTPLRVAKSLEFLTSGYRKELKTIINEAVFQAESNSMIIARDIEVYSMCEHHMLPFFGRCHVGYIAKDKVLGLSKLARIVDLHARRLQIQERLTSDIARDIQEAVDAEGVGVVMECKHLCMMMRGVEKQNSLMSTSSVLGSFRDDLATRNEFLDLLRRQV